MGEISGIDEACVLYQSGFFCALFKPVYKAVADELHNRNMKLFVHSCGIVWDFISHFIEAGVDVPQFD